MSNIKYQISNIKYTITNQVFQYQYIDEIERYDESYLIDVLCDSTIKKSKILKKDINLIKKICKKLKINDSHNLHVSVENVNFLNKYIFLQKT